MNTYDLVIHILNHKLNKMSFDGKIQFLFIHDAIKITSLNILELHLTLTGNPDIPTVSAIKPSVVFSTVKVLIHLPLVNSIEKLVDENESPPDPKLVTLLDHPYP